MNKLGSRLGTVCFLIKGNQVLLAKIHYHNGNVYWNGIGGFVESGESAEQAVVREFQEELGVVLGESSPVRKKRVRAAADLELDVFTCDKYKGEFKIMDSTISEFKWFDIDKLPFEQMHPGNVDWLPLVLNESLN